MDAGNHRIRTIEADTIRTVAGNGTDGYSGDGGPATDASLNGPIAVYVDHDGHLFIADTQNNRIRKVDVSSGVITTFAGDGTGAFSSDGVPATESSLNEPSGVSGDQNGNVYIADCQNHRIRIVGPAGTIATFAGDGVPSSSGDGGPASSARLNSPESIYTATSGDLYIVDRLNHRIRKVENSGTITAVIGEAGRGLVGDGGFASDAKFEFPAGVSVDETENLFVADKSGSTVPEWFRLWPGAVLQELTRGDFSGMVLGRPKP